MIPAYFLQFTFLGLLLPPTLTPLTSLFRKWSRLSVFDPDGNSAPSLVSAENPHYKAIWICRLYQRYWRVRRGLHCWNSNNFSVNVKQPWGNKTKHFGYRGPKMYYLLAAFPYEYLPRSSPSHPPSPLPSYPTLTPHPAPSSSLCYTELFSSLKAQTPGSALDPCRYPAEQKDLSLKPNPFFLQGSCAGG